MRRSEATLASRLATCRLATIVRGAPALAPALLAMAVAAQDAAVVGSVRSASGRPIADARVTFVPDSTTGVAWLDQHRPAAPPVSGRSDERGRFRIAADATSGCLVVEHDSGLGAVLDHCSPGSARLVVVEPLGALRLGTGAEFAADVLLLRGADEHVVLGRRAGRELRMPVGDYLLLIESAGAHAIARAHVRSGQTLDLDTASAMSAPRLRLPGGATCTPASWPGLVLRPDPDGFVHLPQVRGIGVVRCIDAAGARVEDLWYGADSGVLSWPIAGDAPSRELTVRNADGSAAASVLVCAIDEQDDLQRVRARVWTASDGTARLPLPEPSPAARRRLCAVHPDGTPVFAAPDASLIEFPRMQRTRIVVLSPDGDPLAGARVAVRDVRMPDRVFRTDHSGRVLVPRASGSTPVLLVDHEDHLPCEVALDAALVERGSIGLEAGLELFGVAYVDVDRVASRVRVELRDIASRTRIGTRTTWTDEHGRFRFRGLPDASFTVFAQDERGSATWSGRLSRARPGSTEWRLDLRSEDPPLPTSPIDRGR